MSIKNLDILFNPQRIAVVGASDDAQSVGYHIFKNLIGKGFKGIVHPVNSSVSGVQGIEAYRTVSDIPHPIDLVMVSSQPENLKSVLQDCGKKRVKGIVMLTPDYKYTAQNPHSISEQIKQLSVSDGCRVLGSNSLGFLKPGNNLNASLYPKTVLKGNIALISESGIFSTAFLEHAIRKKIGFSYFISLGSKLDINFADTIDFLAGDVNTRALFLYIETINNGQRFMTSIRNFARNKPIVVVKPGNFDVFSIESIHRSNLFLEEDLIYDAVFKRAGSLRVNSIGDLLCMVDSIAKQCRPKGKRLLIISNSSAPSKIAIDTLHGMNGILAEPSQDTIKRISDSLPIKQELRNPLYLMADASATDYQVAIESCLRDNGVDGVLIICIPFPGIDLKKIAEAIVSAAKINRQIPLFSTWFGEDTASAELDFLNNNGIPTYFTTEQAVKSFMYMYQYDYNLKLLRETPETLLKDFSPDLNTAEGIIRNSIAKKRFFLNADEAKEILKAYGIPVIETVRGDSEGVGIDRHTRHGYEILIGARKTKSFGTVILFGLGGGYLIAEKDFSIGLPPLNQTLARRMMEETKIYRYLQVNADYQRALRSLEEMLVRFSQLIIDLPLIGEIEMNPILLAEDIGIVSDVLIKIDTELPKEYRWRKGDLCPLHLSIPPYPFKFEKTTVIKDGTPILIRPIRAEDEPPLRSFFEMLSAKSVFYRFGSRRINMPHENLARLCQVDYDRDLAFLAVFQDEKKEEILGDVRLNKFADLDSAELSFVVADQWQGKGIGSTLMEYCIKVAREIGIKTLLMEIMKNNHKMIDFGLKYKFERMPSLREDDMEEMLLDLR